MEKPRKKKQITSLYVLGKFNVSSQQNAEGCPTFCSGSFRSGDNWSCVSAEYDVNKSEPYSVVEIGGQFC